MKITDVSLTLFAWDDIPPTQYGQHSRFAGSSALGLLRIRTDDGIEGNAFLGSASNAATTDGQGLITHLKPVLMGKNPLHREALVQDLWRKQRVAGVRAIGAVLSLLGRHVDRRNNKVFLKTKTGELWVAVPKATMALIPLVGPNEFVWHTADGRKIRRETPYYAFREALVRAGIPDPERIDNHSLRRRFVASAGDANIPLPVAMAQTGHKDESVHLKYRQNAPTPDTHAAVERLHALRIEAARGNEKTLPTRIPNWERPDASSAAAVAISDGSAHYQAK